MDGLIELSTEKLLEKFGAGSHKPGSGSAVALQGMLSSQLILTVIDLTCDEKRKHNYQTVLAQLDLISLEINQSIYPRLKELFQLDSEQFDSVIQLRVARDNTKGFKRKRELENLVEKALKLATETPIEVAKLCIKLADFAAFIFNNAFKAVRGDSGVALNSAVGVVAGCLSIIDLNLLSISDEEWIKKINLGTKELKVQYQRLLSLTNDSLLILEKEVDINQAFQSEIKALQQNKFSNPNLSNAEIEKVARKVQIILWNHQDTIWKKNKPKNAIEILKPNIAFEKLLNYRVIKRDTLGTYDILGESIEVAGIIDNEKRAVGISKKFSSSIQNFTLAHELGHALMHKQTVLHRDRAVDSYSGASRDIVELQADKFASYFLMPKKQVRGLFQGIYNMERFSLNEDNIFALTGGSLKSFIAKCRNLRELSRFIASAESLYGSPFRSMAEVFNVSIEAMAIRLEELELIEFEYFVPSSISY
jgi:formiminotetrahydrofolate cyclodeaminase/Zn-dependent peptidase ImmA (M78 family)